MGKASRFKKLRKLERAGEEALIERARQRDGSVVLKVPEGQIKMSQVIEEFAEPLLQGARTDEQIRCALGTAIVAWNLSCLPEERQLAVLQEGSGKQLGQEAVLILQELIRRRLELFPEIDRPILDFEYRGGVLNVVSPLPLSISGPESGQESAEPIVE
jgi:hypothetical protein